MDTIVLYLSVVESSRVWHCGMMSNGRSSRVIHGTSMHHEVEAASCARLNLIACRNNL
jgi:hypothetical protein